MQLKWPFESQDYLNLIHLLIWTQLVVFLNSFLEHYLVGNIWSFFYFWRANEFDKNCIITSQIALISRNVFFKFLFAILGSSYTVFIKKILANLSKSRKIITDCQLNSLLENCLKTQLPSLVWMSRCIRHKIARKNCGCNVFELIMDY